LIYSNGSALCSKYPSSSPNPNLVMVSIVKYVDRLAKSTIFVFSSVERWSRRMTLTKVFIISSISLSKVGTSFPEYYRKYISRLRFILLVWGKSHP
jgi:hypothetical protein